MTNSYLLPNYRAILKLQRSGQAIWIYEICGATPLKLEQTNFRFMRLPHEERIMSKGQDSKKNTKKKPLLSPKEKKAAKAAKKSSTDVLGN